MSSKKIAAIVLVMSTAVFVSFLILGGSAPASSQQISSQNGNSDVNNSNKNPSLLSNPINWVQNLVASATKQIASQNLNNSASNLMASDINSVNLTDLVGQSMFSQMKVMDQSGQNPFQNNDPNSPQGQQMIQQAINGLQNSGALFQPIISGKDLKVSSDNSSQAKISYLNSISLGGNQYLSDPTFGRTAQQIENDISQDCLAGGGSVNSKIAEAYKNVAANYLNITVPSEWLDFHKQMVSYFQKGYLIFSAIANCSQDPIKGYLAAEAMLKFAQDSPTIKIAIEQKADEVNRMR